LISSHRNESLVRSLTHLYFSDAAVPMDGAPARIMDLNLELFENLEHLEVIFLRYRGQGDMLDLTKEICAHKLCITSETKPGQ